MRVIDSSVWIEILADGPCAGRLLEDVPAPQEIAMPSIIELELAKWIAREADSATLRKFLAFSSQCISAPLDTKRALMAAEVHRDLKLATADAIVYAAALEFEAELVTCDRHFESLPQVLYIPNK
ncbi:type II toxin-antitoxin system VapC family toxin [Rhizobium sp. C4]|uniref:type II toxin-antitoxin system VapC family toxin n=1 Tax=Rhizobium sp. C4 TaxID=1349800 RepID=UPI001E33AEC8|nr:type II toxin-antitoxin system VapC family toxin [Rhizobium sp. C4]MCD2173302.1 type II toxin-antitoxin system VapC family toxin [Rhizobium sp. C4]